MKVDFLEAGSSGPVVMLVHSSVSGARQWRRLMNDLKDRFRVRAVNLFGYGKTPPWPAETLQSLDDQARLVEAALPADADEIYLVGHSFGGSVAMKAAARLAARVTKLVLLETNPFYLLWLSGRRDAFAEAMDLRNCIKKFGALGEWATAAEKFADYWGGVHNKSLILRDNFREAYLCKKNLKLCGTLSSGWEYPYALIAVERTLIPTDTSRSSAVRHDAGCHGRN
jgi:pimeloyl-ACP methyl ester carboxylesterase